MVYSAEAALRFICSKFTTCVAETAPGEVLSPADSLIANSDPQYQWLISCSSPSTASRPGLTLTCSIMPLEWMLTSPSSLQFLPSLPSLSSQIIVEFLGDKFLVKLPDGHEVEFPNRHGYDKISYLNILGGFKVTSFKVE